MPVDVDIILTQEQVTFQSPIEILPTATPGEYFRLILRLPRSKRAANLVVTQGETTVRIESKTYITLCECLL